MISRADDYVSPDGHKSRMWNCLCDCGNEHIARESALVNGQTKSCGCLLKESVGNTSRKHGGFGTRLYTIWNSMRQRCNNKNQHSYKNYGGRGIKICKEWDDFAVFREWAYQTGYQEDAEYGKYTLDRIDVDGNYSPENCRWISMHEQCLNRRNTLKCTLGNETRTLIEWAEITGIKYQTLARRYSKGWRGERLLSEVK